MVFTSSEELFERVRKQRLRDVKLAIINEWEKIGEVPFPLYDHEAEQLAAAAIAAMNK